MSVSSVKTARRRHAKAHRNPHAERTSARRKAVQLLYQSQMTGVSPEQIVNDGLVAREVGLICDYTRKLLFGAAGHLEELDAMIADTSQNWSIERMPLADKNILRVIVYEMLYGEDVPLSVSINEAVELAKDFGGEDESPRFVNGVLGRIAQQIESKGGPKPA
jgi:N utilization substance protein B